MKKNLIWVAIVIAILVIGIMVFRPGGEDSWIKDERGVWIKHGNPSKTPDYVLEQQEIIDAALSLYEQKKGEGMEFNSQCLGTLEEFGYVLDIVHVPRNEEDNRSENQCEDFKQGIVNHFIELDKDGNIVRIV